MKKKNLKGKEINEVTCQKGKIGFIFYFIQSSVLLNFTQHLSSQPYLLIYFYKHLQQFLSYHQVMSLSANQSP